MPAKRNIFMAHLQFEEWLRDVKFENYSFNVESRAGAVIYLQITFAGTRSKTGVKSVQHGRQWMLHPDMSRSEVVQTAFKAVLASVEHEARESFTYRGQAIFGPHYDVETLLGVCAAGGHEEHRPIELKVVA